MAETKQTHSLMKRALACLMSVVLVAGIIASGTLTAFAEPAAKTGTTEPVATANEKAPGTEADTQTDTKTDPSPAKPVVTDDDAADNNAAATNNDEGDDEEEALESDESDDQAAEDAAAAAAAAGAASSMTAEDQQAGEIDKSKAYAVYKDGTLTFKYDANMPESDAWDVSNTEKTQPWSKYAADIKTVVFDKTFKDVTPLSTCAWFKGCEKLETITDLKNLDTSKTTNMAEMFSGCKALKELDLSAANTKKVEDMKDAFKDCSKLESVKLGKDFSFKTIVVKDDKEQVGEKSTWGELPTPPTTEPNTGKWWKDQKADSAKTPAEMQELSGSDLEGTWTWEVKEKPTPTTEYKVTIANPENGSVTVSPTEGKAGTTVTVEATPNDGYELDKITYTDKDGKEVDITEAKKFDMPEADTTVKATFKKVEPGEFIIEADSSAWQKAHITSSVADVQKAVKLNSDEQKQLDSGTNAYVYVTASKATDVSSDLQQKLKKAPGDGYYVGALADIKLYVRMGADGTPRQITDPDSTIKVTVNMLSSLIKEGKEYDYAVAYEHDGNVKTAKSSFDKDAKTLTITSEEFSTYAIDYKSKTTSTGSTTTKSTTSPKTGDPLNIIPIVAIVIVALGVVIFAGVRMSRSRNRRE